MADDSHPASLFGEASAPEPLPSEEEPSDEPQAAEEADPSAMAEEAPADSPAAPRYLELGCDSTQYWVIEERSTRPLEKTGRGKKDRHPVDETEWLRILELQLAQAVSALEH